MRPDVKLGVVISMVFVLVAGGYYLYRGQEQRPIPIASGQEAPSDPAASGERPRDTAADSEQKPSPTRGQLARRGSSPSAEGGGPQVARPRTTPRKAPTRRRTAASRKQPAHGQAAVPSKAGRRVQAGRQTGSGKAKLRRRPEVPRPLAQQDRAAGEKLAGSRPAAGGPQAASDRSVPLVATKAGTKRGAISSETGRGEVAVDTHRVQRGDTFSSLAERYYGSAKFARFLVENNPQLAGPDQLRVGAIVRIPPRPSAGERPGFPAANSWRAGPVPIDSA